MLLLTFIFSSRPGLLSEGPVFDSLGPQPENTFVYKFDSLNQYRSYNRNISETFHIEYIDLRGELMIINNSIPLSTVYMSHHFYVRSCMCGNVIEFQRDFLYFFKCNLLLCVFPVMGIAGSLMQAVPPSWQLARWYVTGDGEHPNYRGTRILAREYGKVINGWLTPE